MSGEEKLPTPQLQSFTVPLSGLFPLSLYSATFLCRLSKDSLKSQVFLKISFTSNLDFPTPFSSLNIRLMGLNPRNPMTSAFYDSSSKDWEFESFKALWNRGTSASYLSRVNLNGDFQCFESFLVNSLNCSIALRTMSSHKVTKIWIHRLADDAQKRYCFLPSIGAFESLSQFCGTCFCTFKNSFHRKRLKELGWYIPLICSLISMSYQYRVCNHTNSFLELVYFCFPDLFFWTDLSSKSPWFPSSRYVFSAYHPTQVILLFQLRCHTLVVGVFMTDPSEHKNDHARAASQNILFEPPRITTLRSLAYPTKRLAEAKNLAQWAYLAKLLVLNQELESELEAHDSFILLWKSIRVTTEDISWLSLLKWMETQSTHWCFWRSAQLPGRSLAAPCGLILSDESVYRPELSKFPEPEAILDKRTTRREASCFVKWKGNPFHPELQKRLVSTKRVCVAVWYKFFEFNCCGNQPLSTASAPPNSPLRFPYTPEDNLLYVIWKLVVVRWSSTRNKSCTIKICTGVLSSNLLEGGNVRIRSYLYPSYWFAWTPAFQFYSQPRRFPSPRSICPQYLPTYSSRSFIALVLSFIWTTCCTQQLWSTKFQELIFDEIESKTEVNAGDTYLE